MGEYYEVGDEPHRWIARRDAALAARLIRILTTQGKPKINMEYVPFRFRPRDAKTPSGRVEVALKQDRHAATRLFEKRPPHACFYLGSPRANNAAELFLADVFGCTPFCDPGTNRPPVYLRYRQNDQHPRSCIGHATLPQDIGKDEGPGIYYREPSGKWKCLPWIANQRDAGLVLSVMEKNTGRVEIAAFGFSGVSTDAIGECLESGRHPVWPPRVPVRDPNRHVALHLFGFEVRSRPGGGLEDVEQTTNDVYQEVVLTPALKHPARSNAKVRTAGRGKSSVSPAEARRKKPTTRPACRRPSATER